jgi:hypothetical protein
VNKEESQLRAISELASPRTNGSITTNRALANLAMTGIKTSYFKNASAICGTPSTIIQPLFEKS